VKHEAPWRPSRGEDLRNTPLSLGYSVYSLLSTLLAHCSLGCLGSCLTLDDHDASKRALNRQKALNRGTHPQTGPGAFHPLKIWTFAILSPIEFLAKMAYGSGMNNQAIEGRKSDLAITVRPPNVAIYSRGPVSSTIEAWLSQRGFIISKQPPRKPRHEPALAST
jgi:hypothetical protein